MELRWRRDQGDYILLFYAEWRWVINISMSHWKYSAELYNVHIVPITVDLVFVLARRIANAQSQTHDHVQEQ